MPISKLFSRLAPIALVAVFVASCGGGEPKKPAVDPVLLKSRLEQIVDALKKTESTEVKVIVEGAVNVEAKEDGTVTGRTPKIKVVNKDEETMEFDSVILTFKRGENDDTIPVEFRFPDKMIVKDKTGKVKAEASIGSQTITGVWRDDLQNVDKLNVRLGNIAITPKDEEGKGSISEITMSSAISDKGNGLYDMAFSGAMNGLAIDDPKQKSVIKMGQIGFHGKMEGAKLKAYAAAAKAAGYTLSNPDMFKMWTTGKIDEKTMAFLKRMPEFLGSLNYGYDVKDISATEDGKPLFALAKMALGLGMSPEGVDKARIRIAFSTGGIKADGENGKPILPPEADIKDAGFDVDISGLPGKELWAIYMQLLPQIQQASLATAGGNTGAGSEAMTKVGEEAMAQFTAALQKSQLGFALNKFNLDTPTLVMGGSGAAKYNPAVDLMPEGKFALRFSGVEALSDAMAKRGKEDEMAQQVMGALMAIKAIAKPDPTAPQGRPGYLIEVEVKKDGGVTANGQKLM
jgi:hypothetical protein